MIIIPLGADVANNKDHSIVKENGHENEHENIENLKHDFLGIMKTTVCVQ